MSPVERQIENRLRFELDYLGALKKKNDDPMLIIYAERRADELTDMLIDARGADENC